MTAPVSKDSGEISQTDPTARRALQARRNRRLAFFAGSVALCMVGAAYAAVPLYQLFCQVTGYGGTTQQAEESPGAVSERKIVIRFNADVARDMPWQFAPASKPMEVRVGEQALAFYRAKNPTDEPVTGQATYNVTPQKAGIYFNKIDCFCFTRQTLAAGAAIDMPVSFFVDPAIEDDPNLDDITAITLSYTFFEVEADEAGNKAIAPAQPVRAAANLSDTTSVLSSTRGGS